MVYKVNRTTVMKNRDMSLLSRLKYFSLCNDLKLHSWLAPQYPKKKSFSNNLYSLVYVFSLS